MPKRRDTPQDVVRNTPTQDGICCYLLDNRLLRYGGIHGLEFTEWMSLAIKYNMPRVLKLLLETRKEALEQPDPRPKRAKYVARHLIPSLETPGIHSGSHLFFAVTTVAISCARLLLQYGHAVDYDLLEHASSCGLLAFHCMVAKDFPAQSHNSPLFNVDMGTEDMGWHNTSLIRYLLSGDVERMRNTLFHWNHSPPVVLKDILDLDLFAGNRRIVAERHLPYNRSIVTRETVQAVRNLLLQAASVWSPRRHVLFSRNIRNIIFFTLLVKQRLATQSNLPVLPTEMWELICTFLADRDYRYR